MPDRPSVRLDALAGGEFPHSWRFSGFLKTLSTREPEQVATVLAEVEQAVAEGVYAAGFVAYEAAAALNPDLPAAPPVAGLPLIWFALFQERHAAPAAGRDREQRLNGVVLEPGQGFHDYCCDVERIREYIAAGDCYQVNHTFQMNGLSDLDPLACYQTLCAAQQAPFCAYLDIGSHQVLSASPELFFALHNGCLTTRPMKGTAPRGNTPAQDQMLREQLHNSAKERAENLMIVDLLRNDLGIIAETGTVQVASLFDIESYPTVHQMTSTVTAQLKPATSLRSIFAALFPCGSVTGAPKRRSMEIIAGIERQPRGIYCGAIGCLAPGGAAVFSVAIRTLIVEQATGQASLGVGSAITWDSAPAHEYAECLGKAEFLRPPPLSCGLIESLRLEDGRYPYRERHLHRLAESARVLSFVCDIAEVERRLEVQASRISGSAKVRLVLAVDGSCEMSAEPLIPDNNILRVAISAVTVNSADRLRYHKTTRRELFALARASRDDCDEVLLLNEHGQLTEGSYHTLVVKLAGKLVTPALTCGLLPGVLRGELLERGELVEQVLYPDDLEQAEGLWLINSVRGWRPAILVP